MKVKDYRNLDIELTEETLDHIIQGHAEMTSEEIKRTLLDPDEVRKSLHFKPTSRCTSELYYKKKIEITIDNERFSVVIIKICPDGNFVSTAYTADGFKDGEVIFKKKR